jgi:hypothetical protein
MAYSDVNCPWMVCVKISELTDPVDPDGEWGRDYCPPHLNPAKVLTSFADLNSLLGGISGRGKRKKRQKDLDILG